jgi:hypothetical protein
MLGIKSKSKFSYTQWNNGHFISWIMSTLISGSMLMWGETVGGDATSEIGCDKSWDRFATAVPHLTFMPSLYRKTIQRKWRRLAGSTALCDRDHRLLDSLVYIHWGTNLHTVRPELVFTTPGLSDDRKNSKEVTDFNAHVSKSCMNKVWDCI